MEKILALMLRLEGLKRTVRTGWNLEFPADHHLKLKARKVKDAESVADHSWSLAMFALAVAEPLNLDTLKIVWMALVHDVAELVTLDIVTATLDEAERIRVESEKRVLEDAAMREIFLPMGKWGQHCYELWLEFEDQTSPEARVLKQLDKLEACIQSLLYREQSQQVEPEEFFAHSDEFLKHPDFIAMMALLRARAAG